MIHACRHFGVHMEIYEEDKAVLRPFAAEIRHLYVARSAKSPEKGSIASGAETAQLNSIRALLSFWVRGELFLWIYIYIYACMFL